MDFCGGVRCHRQGGLEARAQGACKVNTPLTNLHPLPPSSGTSVALRTPPASRSPLGGHKEGQELVKVPDMETTNLPDGSGERGRNPLIEGAK